MDWYGNEAGGVAYLDSFGAVVDRMAFVFPDELYYGYPKYVWETVSHEVGHTFNLRHDGTSEEAYYLGHADWAPIMGAGFYSPVSQFSKGEYADANNKQDDLATIRKYLNIVPDTHGNTIATASLLTNKTSVYASIGLYDTADVFKINVAGGKVIIKASVISIWDGEGRANLDLSLTVLRYNGAVIAYSSPTTSLEASITINTIAKGTYYVQIKKTGKGTASTGYTAYGSVGQYTLTARFNQFG